MSPTTVAGIKFICDTDIERYRAETLLTKEPGTIRWLDRMGPKDVFFDVGANIGCYTLYAARRGATVYAFEPHVGNAWKLLQNIEANGLRREVTVVTSPLGYESGFSNFFYASSTPGSSGSQLGHTKGEDSREFAPSAVELKFALSLNEFKERPPTFLKVDVDGNELAILSSGVELLRRVQSVQVEIHPGVKIAPLLPGFRLVEKHYTANGQKQLDAGVREDMVIYNGVFDRV